MISAGLTSFVSGILQVRGYLDEPTNCPKKIGEALARLQRWAGLIDTGELDPETLVELDRPHFCGLPDTLPLNATLCKWPSNIVLYYVRDAFPGLSLNKTWEHMDWVAEQCNAAADLRLERGKSPDAARILCTMHKHDGPGGVLADAQLPCGAIRQSLQRYDSGEKWDTQILARLVMLHETLHSLGVPHISGRNVMAPTYNPALEVLQTGDIAELQRRYGKPIGVPTPPSPKLGTLSIDLETKLITAPQGWRIETR